MFYELMDIEKFSEAVHNILRLGVHGEDATDVTNQIIRVLQKEHGSRVIPAEPPKMPHELATLQEEAGKICIALKRILGEAEAWGRIGGLRQASRWRNKHYSAILTIDPRHDPGIMIQLAPTNGDDYELYGEGNKAAEVLGALQLDISDGITDIATKSFKVYLDKISRIDLTKL